MGHTTAHNTFYNKVQHLFVGLSVSAVLRKCFSNYRDDRGLCLSRDAFSLCKQQKYYKFEPIARPPKFDSRHISLLDKLTTSPFYINKRTVYITDEDILFDLTLSGDDFNIFLEMYK